jgi:hypothetical protein
MIEIGQVPFQKDRPLPRERKGQTTSGIPDSAICVTQGGLVTITPILSLNSTDSISPTHDERAYDYAG